MIGSLLSNIKDSVQQYVQAISTVLEMNVDIVDDRMIRIAGTGQFCTNLGKRIDNEGNAFKQVLHTKQTLIVENPGSDDVCLDCRNKSNCKEEYEICCPIILDKEVIGVISLAVFDIEKKADILKKQNNFVSFLEQISSLIAAKASEYKRLCEHAFSIQLLKHLINCINEGVIIFNNMNQITDINQKCQHILGNNLEQLIYLKKIGEFTIYRQNRIKSLDEVEYIARVRSKKNRLVGKIHPIVVDGEEAASVFIFQDVTEMNTKLLPSQNIQFFKFDDIIGKDGNFLMVKENAKKLAYSDMNLLITGETGTGKEIFARAIHNESSRSDKPFITVACIGAVESVIEKELFGYSYQPDEDQKLGKVHVAHGGTLYVDEIGDLTLRLQSRLMEIIHNVKEYNIRLIAGTSIDIRQKAESDEFRKDLYYSLKAFEIKIPPVRYRPDDITLLIDYFIAKYCRIEGKKVTLSDDALKLMKAYPWMGNVREIEKIVIFLISIKNDGSVAGVKDLPASILNQMSSENSEQHNLGFIEKNEIIKVLNMFGNGTDSKKKAAKELGIGIATLYRKMHKYGIEEKSQFEIYQNDN
jgi:transcriptional regulator with PAS, ATPase and Fis domain